MDTSEDFYIAPFRRVNKCDPISCPKVKHFSCCNFEEFIHWRYNLMKIEPKLYWNSKDLRYEVRDDITQEVVYFFTTD